MRSCSTSRRMTARGCCAPARPAYGFHVRIETAVHVVLLAPEIPQNTGSIGRLCVASDTMLHLIEPLGFVIDDKHLRRAGLDYWQHVRLAVHSGWEQFLAARPAGRLLLFAARAPRRYTEVRYRPDDVLVF